MTEDPKIRVLVVDDSAFVRKAIARMLNGAPDIEVVGMAGDGEEGLELARTLRPDVITLDIQMPRLGGLDTLRRLLPDSPSAVLLLSSLTQEGADITMRGLELGALDFVDKSTVQGPMNLLGLKDELLAKVRALADAPRSRPPVVEEPAPPPTEPAGPGARAEVVAIGASTGGPAALQTLVPALPAGFPAAVVVVQHIPRGFSRSLAERLASRSPLPVREAVDGERLQPGTVLVAPAGLHLKLHRRGTTVKVSLDEEPRSALHRPSVDVLMTSVARVFGARSLGVVLTGMGSDGTIGLKAIRQAGGRTLVESEESAVIYGMPKSAVDAGVVDRALPLGHLAAEILAAV
jgi:two-component system, chemotaxis family, protein-glutamate methylesterase/glutaminase